MTKKNRKALDRAQKLRIIMEMPEYAQTIGAWLEEAHSSALQGLTSAVDQHEVHRAQGAYRAIQDIREMFAKVFAEEKLAIERQQSDQTGD